MNASAAVHASGDYPESHEINDFNYGDKISASNDEYYDDFDLHYESNDDFEVYTIARL